MNARQLQALDYVRTTGRITNSEFRQLYPRFSAETLRQDCAGLVQAGVLLKVGDRRTTRYILNESQDKGADKMTGRQVAAALKRAVETDVTDEELDELLAQVKAYDEAATDDIVSALLAGFCIGYDAGRQDGKIAVPRSWLRDNAGVNFVQASA